MITHTWTNLILIRLSILLLQHAPLHEAALLLILHLTSPIPRPLWTTLTKLGLLTLLTLEALFYLALYRPHKARLQQTVATHPNPPDRSTREALFARCVAHVPDWERYLRGWFQGADAGEIRRENVREFVGWAFFGRNVTGTGTGGAGGGGLEEDEEREMQGYLAQIEALLGRPLPPGRGSATALRLTLDPVEVRYRSVVWYGLVAAVDLVTHLFLCWRHGFVHYAPHPRAGSFPPRIALPPPGGVVRRSSASEKLGYYFREHRSSRHLPVVFIHGIGIGLWPYREFLGELYHDSEACEDEQVGVLALEMLSFSARLTSPPLSPQVFLEHVTAILAQHGQQWDRFVLVTHSYGSVVATHMLRSPVLGPRVCGLVLIDPVSVLLHLPDVAYNFTRRVPRTANEWQLWYFASVEMGVAEGLGRHFFWSENIIWREELLLMDSDIEIGEERDRQDKDKGGTGRTRRVAVCLSGKDLIVDTHTVARYLVSDGNRVWYDLEEAFKNGPGALTNHLAPSGLEVLWFPHLDHAQMFEYRNDRKRVVDVISRFCRV
jgi:pimeloyl-ACP methyl ester carboxylesterase